MQFGFGTGEYSRVLDTLVGKTMSFHEGEKFVFCQHIILALAEPDYPLIPVNTTPCVKMRWEKKNSRMGGTIINTETAMIRWVLMV